MPIMDFIWAILFTRNKYKYLFRSMRPVLRMVEKINI